MIWINGRAASIDEDDSAMKKMKMFAQSFFGSRNAGSASLTNPPLPLWDTHASGGSNTLRLGEVSSIDGAGALPRNFSADMTMDELYLFGISGLFKDNMQALQIESETLSVMRAARELWFAGRYYRPRGDAVFHSAPIHPSAAALRRLSPPSATLSPIATATGPAGGQDAAGSRGFSTVAEAAPTGRLLGASWTWYAEEYSRVDGAPIVIDHGQPRSDFIAGVGANKVGSGSGTDDPSGAGGLPGSGSPSAYYPVKGAQKFSAELGKAAAKVLRQDDTLCTLAVRIQDPQGHVLHELRGADGRGFTDAGFSRFSDAQTRLPYVEFDLRGSWSYEVKFNLQGLKSDSILLGTPVFDDVTFYYMNGEPEYLSWTLPMEEA